MIIWSVGRRCIDWCQGNIAYIPYQEKVSFRKIVGIRFLYTIVYSNLLLLQLINKKKLKLLENK